MEQSLQIFTASSGYPSAKILFEDESVRHIHSTVSPEKESDFFKDINFWGDTILFVGFGAGYHILDKVETIPTNTKIVVIDFFEEFTINSDNEIFKTRDINTINKDTSNKKIKELLSGLNSVQIIKHPASYDINKTFYDDILKSITYSTLKTDGNVSRKKVLLLYGTFFLEDEVYNAIEDSENCTSSKFDYNSQKSNLEYENNLYKQLQEEKPDLIISINCKGIDGEGYFFDITSQLNIPIALWFVDDPHPILLNQKQHIKQNTTAFCWEKSYISYLQKINFNSVLYLPLACDPSLFSIANNGTYLTEVGFIGSSMGEDFLNNIKSKFLWKENLQNLNQKAAELLINSPEENPWVIIHRVSKELGLKIPFEDERNRTWLCSHVIHTASMLSRKETISNLKEYSIELFGDPAGWQKLVGNDFKRHGNIDYRNGLCRAYQNIAININITSRQMPSAVNQRVFDIPLSGSFVISDNQADMHTLFEIGNEAIIYENYSDLKHKISYYLSNPVERTVIIKNAKKRIKSEHTYSHRLETILNNT